MQSYWTTTLILVDSDYEAMMSPSTCSGFVGDVEERVTNAMGMKQVTRGLEGLCGINVWNTCVVSAAK